MLSGSELRNLFNIHMRKLYLAKDSSGRASGKSGTLTFNSKTDIDLFIEKCYDLLDELDDKKELEDKEIIVFLKQFESKIKYLFENPLKEETVILAKDLTKKFFNSIKENKNEKIKEKIDNILNRIQNFKYTKTENLIKETSFKIKEDIEIDTKDYRVPEFSSQKEKKPKYKKEKVTKQEYIKKDTKTISQENEKKRKERREQYKIREQITKEEKAKAIKNQKKNEELERLKNISITPQQKKRNNIYNNYIKKIVHYFTPKKLIYITLAISFFIFIAYCMTLEIPEQKNNNIINNNSELKNNSKIEEEFIIPPAPTLAEFTLTQLEKDVIKGINDNRIRYGKSKYEINLELSEILNDYLRIGLNEDFEKAKSKIGDLSVRAKKGNAGAGLFENSFEFDNSKNLDYLINNIRNSNLYLEEYKGIAITIIEKDDKYNVMLNIYKNE